MLEKVNANRKFLILTDQLFYDLFNRYSDGKISNTIEIIKIPETINCNCVKSPKAEPKVNLKFDDPEEFQSFWQDLLLWLSNEREIDNWTVKSGFIGESFTAGLFGNFVIIKTPSAVSSIKMPKKDLRLIHDNWDNYIKEEVSRGELTKKSRFTKYAISIIHQYLNKQNNAS